MLTRVLLLSQCAQLVLGSTDVVIAHHAEDLAWLSSVVPPVGADKPRALVYTKGEDEVRLPAMKMSGEVRNLPNVGRESHSYLTHIVDNYDNLADWTVFSQAAAPSFGYRGHRGGGGHLLAGDSFSDYLVPSASGSRFIYTSVVELPTLHHTMRISYCVNDTRVENGLEGHTAAECPASTNDWTEWWEVGWLASYLSAKVESQGGETPIDFYREYIDPEHKQRQTLSVAFAQGARFAVSRETIRRRPKADYEKIRDTLALDEDPYSGYYMEWLWGDLFLGHTEKCALPPALKTGAVPVSHQDAMDRLAFRYYEGRNGQLLPASSTPSEIPAQFRRRKMSSSVSGDVSGDAEEDTTVTITTTLSLTLSATATFGNTEVNNLVTATAGAITPTPVSATATSATTQTFGSDVVTTITLGRRLAASAAGERDAIVIMAIVMASAADATTAAALIASDAFATTMTALVAATVTGATFDGISASCSACVTTTTITTEESLSGGVIAGIAVGGVAGVGLIGGGVFFAMKKNKVTAA